MNKFSLTLLGCLAAAQIAGAQTKPAAVESNPAAAAATAAPEFKTQRFDLDFPGGNPADLVTGVERATQKRLNVIIPVEVRNTEIAPMRMSDVTVPELFEALATASHRQIYSSGGSYIREYSFRGQGRPENPIWVFSASTPPPERATNICRFYQLGHELASYTIEDITTAIQTGWKMLGLKEAPQLKFHPETKLLIAVGPPDQLQTIDLVLKELLNAPPEPKKPASGSEPPKRP